MPAICSESVLPIIQTTTALTGTLTLVPLSSLPRGYCCRIHHGFIPSALLAISFKLDTVVAEGGTHSYRNPRSALFFIIFPRSARMRVTVSLFSDLGVSLVLSKLEA